MNNAKINKKSINQIVVML